ncbi:MAG: hypothetical protein SynsKO_04990 [Synoicihabitans sp.]
MKFENWRNVVGALLAASVLQGVPVSNSEVEQFSDLDSKRFDSISNLTDLGEFPDPPRLKKSTKPVYPFSMRRKGMTGHALVGFVVSTKGKVLDAYPIWADHPEFGSAAAEAVLKWQYERPRLNGRPVNVRMQVPVVFSIFSGPRDSSSQNVQVLLEYPRPKYPFSMRRSGLNGEVEVSFSVDAVGVVQEPYVSRASHHGFRSAAIAAVMKRRYSPSPSGIPYGATHRIPVVFSSSDSFEEATWEVVDSETEPYDEAPKLRAFNPPCYPRSAVVERRVGKVTIEFRVGIEGSVLETEAIDRADEDLVDASIAAVQSFKFVPMTRGGEPCEARLKMDFEFNFESTSDAEISPDTERLAGIIEHSSTGLLTLGQLDEGLRPLFQSAPVTPPDFKNLAENVEFNVEFIISRSGAAELPTVSADVDSQLAYAAMQAISAWQFTIPRKGGRPVDVRAVVPMVFQAGQKSEL